MPDTQQTGPQASCTVVVCTRNRPDQLNACLESLHRQQRNGFQVLVVDNASDDSRTREVALRWGAQYLPCPIVGLSRARNQGALARTDLVAFIDDDAVADAAWLESLVAEFADPAIAAVAGRTLPLVSDTDEGRRVAALSNGHDRDQRRVVDQSTPDWFAIANFGGIGDGNNMAFRRSSFDHAPPFLSALGRGAWIEGGEEHFAFFSLIRRGYRVAYTPKAVVSHRIPTDMEQMRKRHLQALATAGAYMTFLLAEAGGYRRALLRYVLDFVRRTRRPWRPHRAPLGAGVVPRWRALLAVLQGPFIYLHARWKSGGRLAQPSAEEPQPAAVTARATLP